MLNRINELVSFFPKSLQKRNKIHRVVSTRTVKKLKLDYNFFSYWKDKRDCEEKFFRENVKAFKESKLELHIREGDLLKEELNKRNLKINDINDLSIKKNKGWTIYYYTKEEQSIFLIAFNSKTDYEWSKENTFTAKMEIFYTLNEKVCCK